MNQTLYTDQQEYTVGSSTKKNKVMRFNSKNKGKVKSNTGILFTGDYFNTEESQHNSDKNNFLKKGKEIVLKNKNFDLYEGIFVSSENNNKKSQNSKKSDSFNNENNSQYNLQDEIEEVNSDRENDLFYKKEHQQRCHIISLIQHSDTNDTIGKYDYVLNKFVIYEINKNLKHLEGQRFYDVFCLKQQYKSKSVFNYDKDLYYDLQGQLQGNYNHFFAENFQINLEQGIMYFENGYCDILQFCQQKFSQEVYLDQNEIIYIFKRLCDIVLYLHKNNIYLQNISTQNIFLTPYIQEFKDSNSQQSQSQDITLSQNKRKKTTQLKNTQNSQPFKNFQMPQKSTYNLKIKNVNKALIIQQEDNQQTQIENQNQIKSKEISKKDVIKQNKLHNVKAVYQNSHSVEKYLRDEGIYADIQNDQELLLKQEIYSVVRVLQEICLQFSDKKDDLMNKFKIISEQYKKFQTQEQVLYILHVIKYKIFPNYYNDSVIFQNFIDFIENVIIPQKYDEKLLEDFLNNQEIFGEQIIKNKINDPHNSIFNKIQKQKIKEIYEYDKKSNPSKYKQKNKKFNIQNLIRESSFNPQQKIDGEFQDFLEEHYDDDPYKNMVFYSKSSVKFIENIMCINYKDWDNIMKNCKEIEKPSRKNNQNQNFLTDKIKERIETSILNVKSSRFKGLDGSSSNNMMMSSSSQVSTARRRVSLSGNMFDLKSGIQQQQKVQNSNQMKFQELQIQQNKLEKHTREISNVFQEFIQNSKNQIQIFIGQKGSGKTALLNFIQRKNYFSDEIIYIKLSQFDSVESLKSRIQSIYQENEIAQEVTIKCRKCFKTRYYPVFLKQALKDNKYFECEMGTWNPKYASCDSQEADKVKKDFKKFINKNQSIVCKRRQAIIDKIAFENQTEGSYNTNYKNNNNNPKVSEFQKYINKSQNKIQSQNNIQSGDSTPINTPQHNIVFKEKQIIFLIDDYEKVFNINNKWGKFNIAEIFRLQEYPSIKLIICTSIQGINHDDMEDQFQYNLLTTNSQNLQLYREILQYYFKNCKETSDQLMDIYHNFYSTQFNDLSWSEKLYCNIHHNSLQKIQSEEEIKKQIEQESQQYIKLEEKQINDKNLDLQQQMYQLQQKKNQLQNIEDQIKLFNDNYTKKVNKMYIDINSLQFSIDEQDKQQNELQQISVKIEIISNYLQQQINNYKNSSFLEEHEYTMVLDSFKQLQEKSDEIEGELYALTELYLQQIDQANLIQMIQYTYAVQEKSKHCMFVFDHQSQNKQKGILKDNILHIHDKSVKYHHTEKLFKYAVTSTEIEKFKVYKFQFHVKKMGNQKNIGIGVCKSSVVDINKNEFIPNNINKGFFLMTGCGKFYGEDNNPSEQIKQTGYEFQEGDIVYLTIDSYKNTMQYSQRLNPKSYTNELYFDDDNPYKICLMCFQNNDNVELIKQEVFEKQGTEFDFLNVKDISQSFYSILVQNFEYLKFKQIIDNCYATCINDYKYQQYSGLQQIENLQTDVQIIENLFTEKLKTIIKEQFEFYYNLIYKKYQLQEVIKLVQQNPDFLQNYLIEENFESSIQFIEEKNLIKVIRKIFHHNTSLKSNFNLTSDAKLISNSNNEQKIKNNDNNKQNQQKQKENNEQNSFSETSSSNSDIEEQSEEQNSLEMLEQKANISQLDREVLQQQHLQLIQDQNKQWIHLFKEKLNITERSLIKCNQGLQNIDKKFEMIKQYLQFYLLDSQQSQDILEKITSRFIIYYKYQQNMYKEILMQNQFNKEIKDINNQIKYISNKQFEKINSHFYEFSLNDVVQWQNQQNITQRQIEMFMKQYNFVTNQLNPNIYFKNQTQNGNQTAIHVAEPNTYNIILCNKGLERQKNIDMIYKIKSVSKDSKIILGVCQKYTVNAKKYKFKETQDMDVNFIDSGIFGMRSDGVYLDTNKRHPKIYFSQKYKANDVVVCTINPLDNIVRYSVFRDKNNITKKQIETKLFKRHKSVVYTSPEKLQISPEKINRKNHESDDQYQNYILIDSISVKTEHKKTDLLYPFIALYGVNDSVEIIGIKIRSDINEDRIQNLIQKGLEVSLFQEEAQEIKVQQQKIIEKLQNKNVPQGNRTSGIKRMKERFQEQQLQQLGNNQGSQRQIKSRRSSIQHIMNIQDQRKKSQNGLINQKLVNQRKSSTIVNLVNLKNKKLSLKQQQELIQQSKQINQDLLEQAIVTKQYQIGKYDKLVLLVKQKIEEVNKNKLQQIENLKKMKEDVARPREEVFDEIKQEKVHVEYEIQKQNKNVTKNQKIIKDLEEDIEKKKQQLQQNTQFLLEQKMNSQKYSQNQQIDIDIRKAILDQISVAKEQKIGIEFEFMQSFNEKQIQEFISNELDNLDQKQYMYGINLHFDKEKYFQFIRQDPALFQLSKQPFILKLLIEAMISIQFTQERDIQQALILKVNDEDQQSQGMSRYLLYKEILNFWGKISIREYFHKIYKVINPLFLSQNKFILQKGLKLQAQCVDILHQFNMKICAVIFQEYKELFTKKKVKQLFPQMSSDVMNILLNMSPIISDNVEHYKYICNSLKDFYVAMDLINELDYLISQLDKNLVPQDHLIQPDILQDLNLNKKVLSIENKEILKFIHNYFCYYHKKNKNYLKQLLEIIIVLSKTQDNQNNVIQHICANAATIYNTMFTFCNLDLSNCKLQGAVLVNGIFYKTNLRNANLQHVDFTNSILTNANLTYCRTDQIVLGSNPNLYWVNSTSNGHLSHIMTIDISKDGQLIASGSRDKQIKIWSSQTGELSQTFVGHDSIVKCVCFSPQFNIEILERSRQSSMNSSQYSSPLSGKNKKQKFSFDSVQEYINNYNTHILASCGGRQIILWDLQSLQMKKEIKHTYQTTYIQFNSTGHNLISSDDSGYIIIWDLKDYSILKKIHASNTSITALCVTKNFIATGSIDKKLCMLQKQELSVDQQSNYQYQFLQKSNKNFKHEQQVSCIAISKNQQYMISGSYDFSFKVWQINPFKSQAEIENEKKQQEEFYEKHGIHQEINYKPGLTLKFVHENAHRHFIHSIRFLDDNKIFVSTGGDNKLKIWNIDDLKQEIETIKGHLDSVYCVAICQKNKIIVSGGQDNSIKIWKQYQNGQGNQTNQKLLSMNIHQKGTKKVLNLKPYFQLEVNICSQQFDCSNANFANVQQFPFKYEYLKQNVYGNIAIHLKTHDKVYYLLTYLTYFKQIYQGQPIILKENYNYRMIKWEDIQEIQILQKNTKLDICEVIDAFEEIYIDLKHSNQYKDNILNMCQQVFQLKSCKNLSSVILNLQHNKLDIPDIQNLYQQKEQLVQNNFWIKEENVIIHFDIISDNKQDEDNKDNEDDQDSQNITQYHKYLRGQQINDYGMFLISEQIQYCPNLNYVYLDLQQNFISEKGLSSLKNALITNRERKIERFFLYLGQNNIGDSSIYEISEIILKNKYIKNIFLGLTWNNIGEQGFQSLLNALKQTYHLHSFTAYVWGNDIPQHLKSELKHFIENEQKNIKYEVNQLLKKIKKLKNTSKDLNEEKHDFQNILLNRQNEKEQYDADNEIGKKLPDSIESIERKIQKKEIELQEIKQQIQEVQKDLKVKQKLENKIFLRQQKHFQFILKEDQLINQQEENQEESNINTQRSINQNNTSIEGNNTKRSLSNSTDNILISSRKGSRNQSQEKRTSKKNSIHGSSSKKTPNLMDQITISQPN